MHQACDSRIPPLPRKLPRSATEAEKKHRSAVVKERKRCQAVVKNSDRVKMGGHGGHRENAGRKIQDDVECDKVDRVKMGEHGGHRDGTGGHRENAGRKIQDDVECDKVERSFRVGRPKYDLWRLDLCRNGETYEPYQPQINFHPINAHHFKIFRWLSWT